MGVRITDTVLRDAHQSLLATRMSTQDMLPIAEKLDSVGYHSLEVWGGATFDSALRFLKEDPWERLRLLKKRIKRTPLQMLLRGQNVLGYRHYADDVVERFVVKAFQNGVDIFRIFDAVNDVRNMETAIAVAKREGGHVQGAICYTISPVHNRELYVDMARQLAQMGADSICIKDMAGLLTPGETYRLAKAIKEAVPLPLQLHSHCTSGMADMAYLKGIEAGVDVVDTAISTLALGTSMPPTESMVASLKGTPYDTNLDIHLLSEIARYFGEVRKRYRGFESEFMGVDTNVLTYQIPGGMISNLMSQLREQNALDKLPQVLEETPRVREELGFPPLVTPTSQIVGTQAVLNVVTGERYKVIPKEVRQYVQGFYGRPPRPIKDEVRELICGEEVCITCRPADLLEPEMERARREVGGLARSEEDVLSYALFPGVAREYFEWREESRAIDKELVAALGAVLERSQGQGRPVVAPAGDNRTSPWKAAARRAAMRGS